MKLSRHLFFIAAGMFLLIAGITFLRSQQIRAQSVVTSYVRGVSYTPSDWTGASLTQFMKDLTNRAITLHTKTSQTTQHAGMLFEFARPSDGRKFQDILLDTMHDGAWFGNALTTAYRATGDSFFVDKLNAYPLKFYPYVLNNSDQLFVLGIPDSSTWVNSVSSIPTPQNTTGAVTSKGVMPYWWDDGESWDFSRNRALIGYKGQGNTSKHMSDDMAMLLANGWKLTRRSDVATALKYLALANRIAFDDGTAYSGYTTFLAQKVNPGDSQLQAQFGSLAATEGSPSFTSQTNPPFGRGNFYGALYLNENHLMANQRDGLSWFYYKRLMDQDRTPMNEGFAKDYIYNAYADLVWKQLWMGDTPRQPGLHDFDLTETRATEKFSPYFDDNPNHIQGSRVGPMVMWNAAVALQFMKKFPASWVKYRDTAFPTDTKVEIRWIKPSLDGQIDASGYSSGVDLGNSMVVRFASYLDTLYVHITKPLNSATTFSIYSRPGGTGDSAVLSISAAGDVSATGRGGLALTLNQSRFVSGSQELIEIALPYTVKRGQNPWANAIEDTRLSVKGTSSVVTNLYFLSSEQTVLTQLEKDIKEGLRFWQFIFTDWGMIPSGFYPQPGNNALAKTAIWYNFSDTGGYAHLINAAAVYKQYLENKYDWELYSTVTSGSIPTPTPTVPTTPTPTVNPTNTPVAPTATRTPTPQPTVLPTSSGSCNEDINNDAFVDLSDYSLLAANFLKTTFTNPRVDINRDGIVDLSDYSLLSVKFLKACQGPTSTIAPTLTRTPTPSNGPTPTPTTAQQPTSYFPYGLFEDGNTWGGVAARTQFVSDLRKFKAAGIDDIIYTNSTPHPDLTDQEGVNVVAAPMDQLNPQWWNNTTTPETIENARAIAYPIVDSYANRTSIKAFNLVDDADHYTASKIALMTQAFNERSGSKPSFPMAPSESRFKAANAPVYMAYIYPVLVTNNQCDFNSKAMMGRYANNFAQALQIDREKIGVDTNGLPHWTILQSHGYQSTVNTSETDTTRLRTPSPEEIRLQHWIALGEGVDGIGWFIYRTQQFWIGLDQNIPLWNEVVSLTARVKPHRATLLTLKKYDVPVYTASAQNTLPTVNLPYVSTMTNQTKSKWYVIVANHSCSAQSIQLNSVYSTAQLRDVETGTLYNEGQFISFAGGDGKMFEVMGAVTAPTVNASTNIVTNASFELGTGTDATGWSEAAGMSRDTTTAKSGTASMKFTSPMAYNYVTVPIGTLKPNTQYAVSYWVKTQNVTGNGVNLRYAHISPSVGFSLPPLGMSWVSGTSGDFKQVTTTFYTFLGMTQARFDLQFELTNGSAWIDDIIICEGHLGCGGLF